MSLATSGALGGWLSALSPDNRQIPAWAPIPQEVQARALQELRSDTGIREAVTRSSAPCQEAEAHEPTCGVCRCPLAGTVTQAWPAQCGHVLHLDCHLDLFRHAPSDERVYCPICRVDEAGDPRPTRCAHGNLDRCNFTRDGSRPCGQRCRMEQSDAPLRRPPVPHLSPGGTLGRGRRPAPRPLPRRAGAGLRDRWLQRRPQRRQRRRDRPHEEARGRPKR